MSHSDDIPALLPADTMRARRHATARTVVALMLREMSSRYGRSPGGYAWAILEPLGMIVLLAIGFALILRTPPLGTSFILFYATGFMPFSLYMAVSGAVATSIKFSRPLLFYPGVTWLDTIIARFLLNTLTSVLVAYVLLVSSLWFTGTRTVIDMAPVVQAMTVAAVLGLGVGCLNCFLFLCFPVWETVWGILNRPLVLASGVIFLYESLPPMARDILWYNPLMHITGTMRSGFYPMYDASYASLGFAMAVALISMALGLMLLRRHHKDLINQ